VAVDADVLDGLFGPGPIFVVEPHADDAFLSLGSSIAGWIGAGRAVTVVTVFFPDTERGDEGRAWADRVGAHWIGFGYGRREVKRGLPRPLLPPEAMAPGATRIWPVGFGNAHHELVRECAGPGELHYIDTPYQQVARLADDCRRALRGSTIEWWHTPERAKWEGSACFPSQSGLFTMFDESIRFLPEILVRLPAPAS
jgi:hypothetical protein